MSLAEQVRDVEKRFPLNTTDSSELARLTEFLKLMKSQGLAIAREYDIPQPDTIGRKTYIPRGFKPDSFAIQNSMGFGGGLRRPSLR